MFLSGSFIVGVYTLIIVPKVVLAQRLPESENFVSHRAAMSMLYLASSIATSAVRLSGRSAASRSRRVLSFRCAVSVVVFFFFFLANFPLSTEDGIEQRGPW